MITIAGALIRNRAHLQSAKKTLENQEKEYERLESIRQNTLTGLIESRRTVNSMEKLDEDLLERLRCELDADGKPLLCVRAPAGGSCSSMATIPSTSSMSSSSVTSHRFVWNEHWRRMFLEGLLANPVAFLGAQYSEERKLAREMLFEMFNGLILEFEGKYIEDHEFDDQITACKSYGLRYAQTNPRDEGNIIGLLCLQLHMMWEQHEKIERELEETKKKEEAQKMEEDLKKMRESNVFSPLVGYRICLVSLLCYREGVVGSSLVLVGRRCLLFHRRNRVRN